MEMNFPFGICVCILKMGLKKSMCTNVLTLGRAIFQPEIIKQGILEQKIVNIYRQKT